MSKFYSRPRIKIPKFQIKRTNINDISILNNKRNLDIKKTKMIKIIVIIIIAILTAKYIIDSVYPIFDSLCETKAKSIATLISNKQATNVMKEHSYDEIFIVEKDKNDNITMIKSNMIVINEIISDIAIKIQEDMDKESRKNIEIAIRKFYRNEVTSWKRAKCKN